VRQHRPVLAAALGLSLALPLSLVAAPLPASAATAARAFDFDGDGFPEQVVGAPFLKVDGTAAGGVTVLEASKKGLATSGTVWTQATEGVPGEPEQHAQFGSAFASADFDRDGYADLAIAAPGPDTVEDEVERGTVTVLFGSARGLTAARSYVLTRAGEVQDDGFGDSVATADFDGDGYADLAVGAGSADPVRGPEYYPNGTVTVFRGGEARFDTSRSTVLTGVRSGDGYDLVFGSSLAVGDVDGDKRPDLVVGAFGLPYDDGEGHGGSVSVCTSTDAGVGPCRQVAFGYITGSDAIAIGNVKGDKRNEIIIGQPAYGSERAEPGSVYTLSLSGSGSTLRSKASELTQSTKGVPGSDEPYDEFGYAVALGDLDRDGYADLVVGSPGEAIGSRTRAGRVTVVYGGKKGYRTSGNKAYDQNTKGIPGTAEADDRFGGALSLVDHDRDGRLDLTVGAPGENGTGAVTTLRGSGKSFTTSGAKTFDIILSTYPTPTGARFGSVLAR